MAVESPLPEGVIPQEHTAGIILPSATPRPGETLKRAIEQRDAEIAHAAAVDNFVNGRGPRPTTYLYREEEDSS